jgi:hypothetical protein
MSEDKLKEIDGILKGTVSTKGQLLKALHKFHNEVGVVLKNVKNPFFKKKYADLNAFLEVIKKPLHDNNLLIVQTPVTGGLETTIYHTSGESISGQMTIEFPKDPQKIGMVITYFRRYMLQSMLFLNAEDDDGNTGKKAKDDEAMQERQGLLTKFNDLWLKFSKQANDGQKAFQKDIASKTNFEIRNAITTINNSLKESNK